MYKLKFAWGSRLVILADYVRATHGAVLQDTNHNLVGTGGENWTLNNDTIK